MPSAVVGVLLLFASCTTPNTTKACSAGSCLDPVFPYCDAEGVISGEPGTCISVSCVPGTIETCVGSNALTCNEQGNGYTHVPCELGCVASGTPHCAYIEPRYLPDVCDTVAPAESLLVSNSASLDPNLDANCNGGLVPQISAPSICVVRYGSISVADGGILKITGKEEMGLGRPIALVTDGDLTIEGTLDVSADGVLNGPGGGVTMSGGMGFVTNMTTHVAGGGAGGKTGGGAGGSASADGGGSNGGAAMADPSLLAALVGGASANRTSTMAVGVGSGGGGGGATLISCHGTVTVTGTIDAGGGGGSGGFLFPFPSAGLPGYGGGAGGYVSIQAAHIGVTGKVFANGGGGGAGMRANQAAGFNGEDGSLSSTVAALGGSAQNGEGHGGAGGVGVTVPGGGAKPTTSPATAGGGGASVGFLQTYTPMGVDPTLTPSAVSPAFQPNGTIKTR